MKNLPNLSREKTKLINLLLIFIIFASLITSFILISKKFPQLIPKSFLENKFSLKKLSFKKALPSPNPSPLPKSSPRPIPHGRKSFSISGGKKTAPQFIKGEIDPCDPEKGAIQRFRIELKSQTPILAVKATVITDQRQTEVPLEQTSGDASSGVWEGQWQVNDSYNLTYRIKLEAADQRGTQRVTITLK